MVSDALVIDLGPFRRTVEKIDFIGCQAYLLGRGSNGMTKIILHMINVH
jgi:hypothetical protein